MSITSRATQFAPYAALTGYQEKIQETARIVEEKFESYEIQN